MRIDAKARLGGIVVGVALCATAGCDKIRQLSPDLKGTVVVPGGSQRARAHNVIPTRQPPRRFVIQIENERSLTYIARELGVTVESLIATNELRTTQLHQGQQLQVDASPADVSRFLANREARKARKAARLKKLAEEKAAKKAAKKAGHKGAKLKAKRRVKRRKTRKKPTKKRRALNTP